MEAKKPELNLQTVKRLPSYLAILKKLDAAGVEYVSTTALIRELKFETVLVRKDLGSLGIAGRQNLGYRPKELIAAIEECLGWNKRGEAFIVGVGALGSALMGYGKLKECGFEIVAAFDVDPAKVGLEAHGMKILHVSKLPNLAKRMGVRAAVMTVPAESAQPVAEMLVQSGFKGIWNFSSVELELPENVAVQNESLAGGLAQFTRKLNVLLAKEA